MADTSITSFILNLVLAGPVGVMHLVGGILAAVSEKTPQLWILTAGVKACHGRYIYIYMLSPKLNAQSNDGW